MRDEFLSREWAEHHQDLSSGIAAAIDAIRLSLTKLHHIQYDAPWLRGTHHRP